ncbi:alcohol dehydrogenase catalytic domain-containing protein [Candidatus Poribacteria bacterium]|nr:alcohol dehydrogenase catalytic domain-containing protein [Candidatus Poribacteria bacterium]
MRYIGKKWGRLYTSPLSSIQLIDIPEPQLPTQQWVKVKTRLSGICGSDLATITAKGSTYFSPFTSTPFILGHEIVGEIAEIGKDVNGLSIGDRVVIEPALSCIVREINPPCIQCENSRFSNCENITRGSISEGVQTGYCRDTGGGWSEYVLAHRSQLRILPDDISDELAVILEPFACSLHGVLQIDIKNQKDICVIGSGTIGLLTVSALRLLGYKNRIIVVAKYPHQKKIAQDLGADVVISPDKNRYLTFSELTNAESYQPELGEQVLIGGVDVTFDCIGSSSTIDDALRFTRSGGDVILLGMPGIPKNIDWVSIWYKQLNVKGAYTYGIETYEGEEIHTFDLGLKFLQDSGEQLLPIVGFSFSLKNYKQAIQTSLNTGTSASVKTIFDFR